MSLQEPWRRSGARSTGVSKVREAVLEACQRLNRPVEESAKALQYLESEWLCDAWTLGALSEEAWKELRLPLGLKEHLRFRFRGTAWAAEARPASPGWARLDAEKPVAMVFQDDRRPPEVPQPREKSSVEALLVRIQEKMSRENRSLKGMARRFKRMDDDLNNYMEFSEFINAMNELYQGLSDQELQSLWRYVDRDGNGRVTFEQFLQIFKPKLSERRRLAVNALFDHLDANRNGVIQIDDLKLRCDPNALAEGVHKVRGVRMQPDQVLVNFLENFRKLVGGSVYGEVRYADFERYYEGLSAGIDSDAYFEELLRKAWDLPSNFFHHLEVDEKPNHISAGTPARVRVIPHHQHHNPTFLDHQQGGRERRGQAHTGQRLLRTLRRCLAQCCRGNASLLYGDLVVRTYVPNPRRGEEAPPKLVPKETFEAVLLRMLPSMLPPDRATLSAIFQDAVRNDCVDYRSFLDCLQAPTAVRQDCALRVFDDLAGAGATNLDLSDAARVIPPGAMTVFGDRQVSLQSWLDFHNLVATAAGETTDAVYEAQLRYLWGLRDANSQGPKLTPVPGYYRGMSRVQLG
ncbi:Calcyphosin (Calcyphosine) [Durusdinium trenchii]|uniref:Calcyphosin (Calcyphosine) n=1 Tax=Durusdinium trenchii TaxID=1381693 RepID=A0ABP0NSV4_9DINO